LDNRTKRAVVIGSGIAGIAISIRLALRGFSVRIFEKEAKPGGKLNEFKIDGFRFDFGPSLFTMPELIEELFILAGKNVEDHFTYHALEETNNYYFEDGTNIKGYTDLGRFAQEVHEKLHVPEERIIKYFKHCDFIYNHTKDVFLNKSLHQLSTYMRLGTLQSFLRIPAMDVFKTMNKANIQRLKHPKLIQLFNRFATYNGSSPYKAPGLLNVIPGLEHLGGAYLPKGGMYDITKSLVKLAKELGVTFHLNEGIRKIEVKAGRVAGIISEKTSYPTDIAISNMDIYHTYHKLLPETKAPDFILNQPRSSSALVFYWGINRTFDQLSVHNIFFSNNYQSEFKHLFDHLDIDDDPTIYIFITSKHCPADAPPGTENWFVMLNAPYNNGQDWKSIQEKSKKNIIKKLNRMLGTDLEKHIVAEKVMDPVILEDKTSSYKGSLYGSSSNNLMAAFLRHPNFTSKVKGLYFCGGSVHPGGGIPLCLLSAKITENLIKD